MLIVIEGLDGSGKSTQVRMLKEHLSRDGRPLHYIHFPRFDAPVYGDLLARFLRGEFGSLESVHPQLVALLFAEDRRIAAPQLREWLAAGNTVLLDRYVYSNIAFQCAKLQDPSARDSLRDWILRTEYGDFGIPRPDINIFLDVPVSFVSEKLSANRRGCDREYLAGASDIHESDMSFQMRVREMYLSQTRRDPGFIRVDCSDSCGQMLPSGVISGKIIKLLGSL